MPLFPKLFPYLRWLIPQSQGYVHNSLLSDAELRKIDCFSHSLPPLIENSGCRVTYTMIGESPSVFRGRGFDFEENRGYQAGDEARALNWHLYARTGSLYTKVFNEERRQQIFLLMDKRASMRFGTRRQLKVELAAKICACYVFMARQSSMAIGGVIMNEELEWFDPATGSDSINCLVHSLTTACPPMDFDQDQPAMETGLQLLVQRLDPGCLVILLSDFLNMEASACAPLLHQLSMKHSVQAIQVLDPVEQRLPVTGSFFIDDGFSGSSQRINGNDVLQRKQYSVAVDQQQSELNAVFSGNAIPFHTFSTEDDLESCFGELSVDVLTP
jgi:uncharacterized protein (DUF58 family)